jgi:hypothetical protein
MLEGKAFVDCPEADRIGTRSLSPLQSRDLELILQHPLLALVCKLLFLHLQLENKSPFLSSKALALSIALDLELDLPPFHFEVGHLDVMRTPHKFRKLRQITTD